MDPPRYVGTIKLYGVSEAWKRFSGNSNANLMINEGCRQRRQVWLSVREVSAYHIRHATEQSAKPSACEQQLRAVH